MAATKTGVFISHIVQESPVALTLQKYLKTAFGQDFPVFVSSDQTSIGGGRKWFEHILANLRTAYVVLVLLSQESAKREWLNFEAGFGSGGGATVIPIVIKEFLFTKVDFPLKGYNGRVVGDIEGILHDIGRETGLIAERIDTLQYRTDMLSAEASLIYKSVIVTPYMSNGLLKFVIENNGNTDLDLLMLETWVPFDRVQTNWIRSGSANVLRYETSVIDGEQYWHAIYTTSIVPEGIECLRPVLTRSMGRVHLLHPAFPLKQTVMDPMVIYYHLHVRSYDTQRESTVLDSVELR